MSTTPSPQTHAPSKKAAGRDPNPKDPFLSNFSRDQQGSLIIAFAQSVCDNIIGRTTRNKLMGNTVKATVRDVGAAFRENFRNYPTTDAQGVKYLPLGRLMNGFSKEDPNRSHQSALPLIVYKLLNR